MIQQKSPKIENRKTSLRTVPVILKHGQTRLKVNTLLDDGSTQSYINTRVADKLGLEGEPEHMGIEVINGQVEYVKTVPVEVDLESLDGTVDMDVKAFTTGNVTGNLDVVDWSIQANRWAHLNTITFPTLANSSGIDMLIGIDLSDLHFSVYKDVRGKQGEPMARLTPLGWTCICVPIKT